MAAKKKAATTAEPKKPKKTRSGKSILLWLPDDLAVSLASYLESCKPSPTTTSLLKMLVQDFLEQKGFYPKGKK